ncbi:Putative cytochrome P450 superfamily protein [Zea mays]|jgi:cytochrome P450|uniref:Putative cytochrome P450 superfamily protein n=1 Tax=Zea mays TaxID=4577 RepID=A0A1D6FG84_MAIZE|nr:Putative cytochrome P450 superfamily protein [Zea mays]
MNHLFTLRHAWGGSEDTRDLGQGLHGVQAGAERWVSRSDRLRHEPSYKFLSFNSGPRSCIGKDVSLSNMKITAASTIHNFKVELVRRGHEVTPQSSVIYSTLRTG